MQQVEEPKKEQEQEQEQINPYHAEQLMIESVDSLYDIFDQLTD